MIATKNYILKLRKKGVMVFLKQDSLNIIKLMLFLLFRRIRITSFALLYTNRAVEVVELTFGVISKPHKWSQINYTLYVLEQRTDT